MVIRIQYRDGRYDMVKSSHLERLVAANLVHQFERGNGWAIIGKDFIRGQKKVSYFGPERRLPSGPAPKVKTHQGPIEASDYQRHA
jgi:hypothetical protein